jgi:transposase
MSKPSIAKRIAFEAGQEQWPVFWCSLLRPLLYGEIAPEEARGFLLNLASTACVFPDGRHGKPSRATLWRKWKQYQEGGFEALFRKRRSDQGKLRRTTEGIIARAVELKKQQPFLPAGRINQFLQAEFQATIPKATLYRHLRRAGATRLKLVDCRQKQDADKLRWESDEKWLAKLAHGKLTEEDLLANASQHMKTEDITTLLQCIREQSSYYRNRAAAVLSRNNEIPIRLIMAFFGVSLASIYRWVDTYEKHGVQVLLRSKFPGRGPHRKVKCPEYTNAVFEILHAPPSAYGINRTTWRLKDIASIMAQHGLAIGRSTVGTIIDNAGYTYRKAKRVLTSTDPEYREKLKEITRILANLGPKEKFFSVDEFGPFSVKMQGGRSLTPPGEAKTFPQYQQNKGSLILTAGLELSTNQITHFYSPAKNTAEMVKLLDILVTKHVDQERIYFSWDAASWHASKALYARVDEVNSMKGLPQVRLAPLPSSAQFLNVIESVFSGMARAVLHNSNYESVDACKKAIDRRFEERNQHFTENPKRAGNKIWGKEPTRAEFSESNNCKAPEASW